MTRRFSDGLEILLQAVILISGVYGLYMFFWLLGLVLEVL